MNKKQKIPLKKIDQERWRFTLYETPTSDWICSFVYSPMSAIDLSMLIPLTNKDKEKALVDRQYLVDLADNVRDNYKLFLDKAIDKNDFKVIE